MVKRQFTSSLAFNQGQLVMRMISKSRCDARNIRFTTFLVSPIIYGDGFVLAFTGLYTASLTICYYLGLNSYHLVPKTYLVTQFLYWNVKNVFH